MVADLRPTRFDDLYVVRYTDHLWLIQTWNDPAA